jgi:hypothetical protein
VTEIDIFAGRVRYFPPFLTTFPPISEEFYHIPGIEKQRDFFGLGMGSCIGPNSGRLMALEIIELNYSLLYL